MKIVQLDLNKENALDILVKDNVYIVRFSEQHGRQSTKRRVIPSHPYGISLKHIKTLSVKEIVELVQSGDAALVEVTMEERP